MIGDERPGGSISGSAPLIVRMSHKRRLDATRFQRLGEVPPEVAWFAKIMNKPIRCAYENAQQDFVGFTGIAQPEEFCIVTRSHVIAWRDDIAGRNLSGQTIITALRPCHYCSSISATATPSPATQLEV